MIIWNGSRSVLTVVLVVAGLLLGGACSRQSQEVAETVSSPAAPPNIVFIIVDALRADHLGCYGYDRQTSPNIDRLAEQALVFDNAYSNASFTVPSTASLFTSTLFVVHRITHNPKRQDHIRQLSDEYQLITEVFQDGGYHTAILTTTGWVSSTANYEQGVDERVVAARSDRDLLDKARQYITDKSSRQFFLYLHFVDMHDYFNPEILFAGVDPEALGLSENLLSLRGEDPRQAYERLAHELKEPGQLTDVDLSFLIDVYNRGLRESDAIIGEVAGHLEAEGLLDNTLLVITSDHGEQFLEHGRLVHGGDAYYNEVLRIPFIIASPGLFPDQIRATTPASSLDFAPTLMEFVGLPVPDTYQGESLKDRYDEDRVVFATDRRTWKATSREWSYIYSKAREREELYNLAEDPGETTDLVAEAPEALERMRIALRAMVQACREHEYNAIDVTEVEMAEEQKERLRQLGYLD